MEVVFQYKQFFQWSFFLNGSRFLKNESSF
jgi:hypothetical protein